MPEELTPINFTIDNIGKTVKSSKKQFIWKLSNKSTKIEITLTKSSLTRKIRIFVSGRCIYEEKRFTGNKFSHDFCFQGHDFSITQTLNSFNLIYDNRSFDHDFGLGKPFSLIFRKN